MNNIIADNFEKVFRTRTRGGNNDTSQRFYVAVVFPQHVNVQSALDVEIENFTQLFDCTHQMHPANSTDGNYFYLSFSSRADFAKFPSMFRYVHKRQAFMRLACWDRDIEPSNAPDDHQVFWAVLAAAQMYYKE